MPEHTVQPELILAILSRGRLESLRRCVNSALAMAGAPIRVVVGFDDDTRCFAAYDPPLNVEKILLRPRHYYVRGMNYLFRKIAKSGADIFAITNNDCEYVYPNWAADAKEELFRSFEDGHGVVELTNSGKLFSFVTRVPFIEERYGRDLFNPCFLQYYADRDRMDDLEENDLYVHPIPGYVIAHPAKDEVNAEGQAFFNSDQLMYRKLHPGVLEGELAT